VIRIGGTTKVIAVIGDPVTHSLSPAMHNAAIGALGLDAVYVAVPVPPMGLAHVLRGFEVAGIAGNVTVPHKVGAAGLIVRLTELAKQLEAVNTFWPDGERLCGDNTDVFGVTDALERLDAVGPWLVIGTGGSARAVAAAARDAGVALVVRSRDRLRAADFVAWCERLGVSASVDEGQSVATVINTSPVGLREDDGHPLPIDRMEGCSVALDLVYAPGETAWCRACRARGLRVSDGRTVLVSQGVRAVSRFFPDVHPPREIMKAAVERNLEAT
jgi:shikimate dehydrogenase